MSGRLIARVTDDGDAIGWRTLARQALRVGVVPDRLDWVIDGAAPDLLPSEIEWPQEEICHPILTQAAWTMIETALCHANPARFALAYRIVWRMQQAPELLAIVTDPDIARLRRMAQAVRRYAHKMTAFVRFREQTGMGSRRLFAAWFEPEHHILRRVAPFFADRFTDMDWLIATPRGAIAWDGMRIDVRYDSFVRPDLSDDLDLLWRTYYGATFNPARVKIQAMQSEMPRKYWRNLPETADIPALLAGAEARMRRMAEQRAQPAPAFHQSLCRRRSEARDENE